MNHLTSKKWTLLHLPNKKLIAPRLSKKYVDNTLDPKQEVDTVLSNQQEIKIDDQSLQGLHGACMLRIHSIIATVFLCMCRVGISFCLFIRLFICMFVVMFSFYPKGTDKGKFDNRQRYAQQ